FSRQLVRVLLLLKEENAKSCKDKEFENVWERAEAAYISATENMRPRPLIDRLLLTDTTKEIEKEKENENEILSSLSSSLLPTSFAQERTFSLSLSFQQLLLHHNN